MGVEISEARKRRLKRARLREERYWASKAGPVTVTRVSEHDALLRSLSPDSVGIAEDRDTSP